MKIKYASILDGSENDYPGKVASVVYVGGCPFRCGYCFSGPLVVAAENCLEVESEFISGHIIGRKANVEAVVFTGGEPLQQAGAVSEICAKLKKEGFFTKIDTNGFYPDKLVQMLPFLDAVSMDIKTEFDAGKYAEITSFRGESAMQMQEILRSIIELKKWKENNRNFFLEIRTTVIPSINDKEEIIEKIAKEAAFADRYVLQQFDASRDLIEPGLQKLGNTPKFRLVELGVAAKKHAKSVKIRTKEEGEQEI